MHEVRRSQNGKVDVVNTLQSEQAAQSFMEFVVLNYVTKHAPVLIYPCDIVAGKGFTMTHKNIVDDEVVDVAVSYVVAKKGE